MRSLAILAVLLAAHRPAAAPVPGAAAVVFQNVTVVPMDRERELPGQDVVVRDGRIASIARHHIQSWPSGTRVVDGTRKFLLPGLCDMHVHTMFGDSAQLQLYLLHGVTTVLNLSGSPEILDWRRRIAAGELEGPALWTAGMILDGDPPTNSSHAIVHDRAEAMAAVRAQRDSGYDFIKPYSALSDSAYLGIVDEAKHDHIRLVGHVSWNVGVERTVRAGQDAIAHVEELYRYFVDRHRKPPPDTRPDPARIPALAKLLHDHGTWVVTTLSANTNILAQATVLDSLLATPAIRYVPASYLAECRTGDPYAHRSADWVLQNRIMVPFLFRITAGLRDAGVRMMAGTDATNPIQVPGLSLHDELAALVRAGLSPYDALVTATRNPAVFLRRADEAGTVAVSKQADLVLVDADPLADVRNAGRIAGVMRAGRWRDRAALDAMEHALVEHMRAE
jgi:hypothetical protein